MRIFIATTFFAVKHDERVFLSEQHYYIIKRYADSFGNITLYARIKNQTPDPKMIDATEIIEKLIGVSSMMNVLLHKDKEKIINDISNSDLVVGRLPSIAACRASDYARANSKPFLAEVMGDAWDAYWNHGVSGKVFAPYIFLKNKKVVNKAEYALYVTQEFLQKRYPCRNTSTGVSNVRIAMPDQEVLNRRLNKIQSGLDNELVLVTTAAVDVRYKGQEYVIKALPMLKSQGINVSYILIGDGDQSYLKSIAEQSGVVQNVIFTGRLSLDELLKVIDNADLYIQPSLQEGLPRSVIEAMSRGCPAIGARTAGIPELLGSEYIFRRKSVQAIAEKISHFASMNKEEKIAVATHNFKESEKYAEEILSKKRNEYYEYIKSNIMQ